MLLLFLILFDCIDSSQKTIVSTKTIVDSVNVVETVPEIIEASFDSVKLKINFKPNGNYSTIISSLTSERNYFKTLLKTNPTRAIDSASAYLYSKLLNDIVPHWYGTDWDFNGHTNIPNEGQIACGYFVSTTLKHLGFNLNRYKMAQQAGLVEAKMLQPKNQLKIYSSLSFEALTKKLNTVYKDGIYFVGLDNHVGYVVIKDKELYFLHSSYCDDKVVIELAEVSPCFASNIYVFAEISSNKDLIKSWILNERLNVPSN